MKDWKYCSDKEIEKMTFDEAREIIEKHIALGHRKGEFRPREHMTRALEIVLNAALHTPQETAREYADRTGKCPMCLDCPDGCPLESPLDPKNITNNTKIGQLSLNEFNSEVTYG